MPPRRPGGKYRGLVKRAKGEATLAKEAEVERRKKLQEFLSRMEEKRQQELMPSAALQTKKEQEAEVRKQRIMNMLVGGNKGNLKKFFRSWITGVAMVKKERILNNRDRCWRVSCNHCVDRTCPGNCSSFTRLQDKANLMPFDHEQARLRLTRMGVKDTEGLDGLEEQAFNQWGASKDALSSLVKSFSGPVGSAGLRQKSWDQPTGPPVPQWLTCPKPLVVSHHKSGRRVLLDPTTMRTCFADMTAMSNRHPLDPSPLAGGPPSPKGTWSPLPPMSPDGGRRSGRMERRTSTVHSQLSVGSAGSAQSMGSHPSQRSQEGVNFELGSESPF